MRAIGFVVVVGLSLAITGSAQACARDGVPSISVNNHLALLNHAQPRPDSPTWAPFVFRATAAHGQVVRLAENVTEVSRALPREAFTRSWRWSFGDHTPTAYGTSVRHRYRRPGLYRITVSAYYPTYGAWETFDLAILRVA